MTSLFALAECLSTDKLYRSFTRHGVLWQPLFMEVFIMVTWHLDAEKLYHLPELEIRFEAGKKDFTDTSGLLLACLV